MTVTSWSHQSGTGSWPRTPKREGDEAHDARQVEEVRGKHAEATEALQCVRRQFRDIDAALEEERKQARKRESGLLWLAADNFRRSFELTAAAATCLARILASAAGLWQRRWSRRRL